MHAPRSFRTLWNWAATSVLATECLIGGVTARGPRPMTYTCQGFAELA